jgi:hypothetical protein
VCIFGDIADGKMYLNEIEKSYGKYGNLYSAVVMPNHFHGIIEILHFRGTIQGALQGMNWSY